MTGRGPCTGTAPGCCLSCSDVFRARYFTSFGPRQQPLFTARLQQITFPFGHRRNNVVGLGGRRK